METLSTPELIPTRFKSKIAHSRSYPIGAEAISSALADVPQYERLELSFWDYKFEPLATNYRVLSISYLHHGNLHSASNDMIERGFHQPRWAVEIKAVPRGQCHAIKGALIDRGLPFAKQWLMQNIADEQQGRSRLSFLWIEEEQRLGYEVDERLQPERI